MNCQGKYSPLGLEKKGRGNAYAIQESLFSSLLSFCAYILLTHRSHHTLSRTQSPIPSHECAEHAAAAAAAAVINLLGDADDAAGRTTARIARRLALLVPALAQVVGAGVHDDGPAEDALGADELDMLVRDGALGVALSVRLEVAKVADVALAVGGGAVSFGEGVDCDGGEKAVRVSLWLDG